MRQTTNLPLFCAIQTTGQESKICIGLEAAYTQVVEFRYA
jgi:hypothetical protein